MQIVSMTCPNCSAGLEGSPNSKSIKCPYCGTTATIANQGGDEALKALRPIANSLSNIQFGTARTESKLDRVIEHLDQLHPGSKIAADPVSPSPVSVAYPTSPGESFAARHVGFLVICCFILIGTLLVAEGIGTALFWAPFIFCGLYMLTGTEANGRSDKIILFVGWIVITIVITIVIHII